MQNQGQGSTKYFTNTNDESHTVVPKCFEFGSYKTYNIIHDNCLLEWEVALARGLEHQYWITNISLMVSHVQLPKYKVNDSIQHLGTPGKVTICGLELQYPLCMCEEYWIYTYNTNKEMETVRMLWSFLECTNAMSMKCFWNAPSNVAPISVETMYTWQNINEKKENSTSHDKHIFDSKIWAQKRWGQTTYTSSILLVNNLNFVPFAKDIDYL